MFLENYRSWFMNTKYITFNNLSLIFFNKETTHIPSDKCGYWIFSMTAVWIAFRSSCFTFSFPAFLSNAYY